ncbi:glycine--tRNA ligase subunit beta [Roseateles sp. NT4]|uniref:glycine--tRNA ligase subunit beta n=1 Tax=Roseateles sp. NT4 TaxID=3453715 RepID=UPI003EEB2B01
MTNLLVELFVEELPPKALKKLGESFAASITEHLHLNDFLEAESATTSFASPRRLGVHISKVRAISEPKPRPPETLMPEAVGLKEGTPTPALLKRLQKAGYHEGVDVGSFFSEGRLFVAEEGGKRVIKHDPGQAAGSHLSIALQGAIDLALHRLPIPKVMTYQLADGWTDVKFVRPAHRLIALHGETVIGVKALGLEASNMTEGHRFESPVQAFAIRSADSYAQQLFEQGAVIASFAERRAEISRQLKGAADALSLKPIDDEALLDEVTALVERPNVLTCAFEAEFLAVPQECLILTMKANQKYFPLLDSHGKLTRHFLVVSNIAPADASAVTQGNERVVRPRLADAKFFFDQDRKKKLADRLPGLAKVVYHGKLGSQGERAERVTAIAHAIVNQLSMATLPYTVDADDEFKVLDSKVKQAAQLAKCDLLTDMVGEFPELQGIMGGYYARHEGLRDGVAIAIEDHYKPRFAGDALPRNHTGTVVALADKLETLVGLFGIGQLPTGDKDPFALRRHALGIIRILVEKNLPLDLPAMIEAALPPFGELIENPQATREALLSFFADRLAVSLRDQGYSAQEVDAVLALAPTRLGDVPKRLEAVRAFAALAEAASLAAANKRVGNILKKVEGELPTEVKAELLKESAEQALAAAIAEVQPQADTLFEQHDYTGSLKALAALKAPVDAFFDDVMVNAEDAALRANRLALLGRLHAAMNRVADLSRLA